MNIKKILLFSLILLTTISFSQNNVQSILNNVVFSSDFKNATISFKAIDLSNNHVLASYNTESSIPTASTTKLFSTALALEILGSEYRAQTKLYIDGVIDSSGILNGNLWIQGLGDCSLGSKYFNAAGHQKDFLKQWVDSLKVRGIKRINGSIIADGSAFGYQGVPDGWTWNDMGNYYGAGPSGICIYDNMLKCYFKTGSFPGSKTNLLYTEPTVKNMQIHNYIISENINNDNSYIFGGPFSLDRFASGALPLNQKSFEVKGSLPDPEYQLACDFTEILTASSIVVDGLPQAVRLNNLEMDQRYRQEKMKLLFTHKGAKLQDIITLTNMKSINLFAEMLVCLIGYEYNGIGTTENGLKRMNSYLETRMNINGLFLKDGSGLSRSNGISATHFIDLLKIMTQSNNYTFFYNSLPVAGKSGTLASLCKDQTGEGRVFAKSGTMNRIKSYCGYINSKTGKKIAFSICMYNFEGSSSNATDKIEKILNALSSL